MKSIFSIIAISVKKQKRKDDFFILIIIIRLLDNILYF